MKVSPVIKFLLQSGPSHCWQGTNKELIAVFREELEAFIPHGKVS